MNKSELREKAATMLEEEGNRHSLYSLADATEDVALDEFRRLADIEMGHGNLVISDIHNADEGWVGVAFTDDNCPVGEYFDTDAETDNEMGAFMRIRTSNRKSIQVLIYALLRADEILAGMQEENQ